MCSVSLPLPTIRRLSNHWSVCFILIAKLATRIALLKPDLAHIYLGHSSLSQQPVFWHCAICFVLIDYTGDC